MLELPTFEELHTFEVSARLLSLTRAAVELHITQGAVSQRIKQLESRLGTPLFMRLGRELQLTTAGHEVLSKAEALLAQRSSLFAPGRADIESTLVIINTTPSLARGWLTRRLPDLHRSISGIRLRVLCSLAFTRFRESTPEIALRFGAGSWPQTISTLLMQDWLYPVASTALAEEIQKSGAEWGKYPLLEDIHMPWRDWFARANRRAPPAIMSFNDAAVMLDAIEQSQGVGLMRHRVVADAIQTGTVVRLSGQLVPSVNSHWIVLPELDALPPSARFARSQVVRWLQEQAASSPLPD